MRSLRSWVVGRSGLGRTGFVVAAAAIGGSAAVAGCGTRSGDGVTTSVDGTGTTTTPPASGYVKLARGVHPLARAEFDRGPVAADRRVENLSLVFKLSPQQLLERDALKAAQLDPASPSYRKWLTPQEYAARFGARAADIERSKAWLASQGLEVREASPLGARVTFAGTAAKIQSAFRAEMHRFELRGESHYALTSSPSVPAELADVVLDVTNTHDFFPRPAVQPVKTPAFTSGGLTGFAPPDWANVYDVAKAYAPGVGGKLLTGAGVTIAIVGIAQIPQSDIDAWRSKFGLPASTVTMTLVPGTGAATPGTNNAGFEAVLDVEWSGGIAKGATVNYVYTGGNDGNVDDATFYAIENNVAPILSESWGGCEGNLTSIGYNTSDQNVIDTFGSAANLLGITYMAASGDSGATSCLGYSLPGLYVNVPAAYPGVTAVGGTQFPAGAFTTGASGYFTAYSTLETTWNEAHNGTSNPPNVGAGGGGISQLFSRPSYQTGLPTCTIHGALPVAGITPSAMREVPDVSFTSAGNTNGLFVDCTVDSATGDCGGTGGSPKLGTGGGTSFATPAFAGVVALMEQLAGGRLGNVNPLLYSVHASTPTAFHDVALGNNEVSCTTAADPGCGTGNLYGYAAATGYDCATGLGSMDVYNFLTAMASDTPTTTALDAAPTATVEGSNVVLTATVAANPPNASPVGGNVTFAFQSYLANGAPDMSWTLGTSAIAAGLTTSGTAALTAPIPPGLVRSGAQAVDVVAMYGGDGHHFASTSAKTPVTFAALSLCVAPTTDSLAAGGTATFAAKGGIAPYKYYVNIDQTCDAQGNNCSTLNETTGAFKAGTGAAGYVLVATVDADGAETFSWITVGSPTGPAPWAGDSGLTSTACPTSQPDGGVDGGPVDGGPVDGGPVDAGPIADAGMPDTGTDAGHGTDAGTPDAGQAVDSGGGDATTTTDSGAITSDDSGTVTPTDSGSPSSGDDAGNAGSGGSGDSSGCGCATAGRESGSPAGVFAGLVLGLGLIGRRRRERR